MTPTIRSRRCKACREQFTPARQMQCACSPACAQAVVAEKNARQAKKAAVEDKRKTRAQLEAIKPRSQWLRECQSIINKIVRIRDAGEPCVSCDRGPSWGGQWHASHLRSVGASPATRFHLWNIHRACSICNNHLSGNLSEYLPRVRARIGDVKVDWLYAQNCRVDHSIPYLRRFKEVMGRRLKRLESRSGLLQY